jgi:predicted HicB family RNase H-like nuclease
MKEPESVKVTLRLPADLVRQAKHRAVDAGQSLQAVVAQALRAFLSRTKQGGGRS